jgi:hypothetical protein
MEKIKELESLSKEDLKLRLTELKKRAYETKMRRLQ